MKESITLHTLPPDVIQEIGSRLLQQDLKRLRLVCSQFNLTFESEVLATLVISITESTLKFSTSQVETLALQKTRAAQHARTLKIYHLLPSFHQPAAPSVQSQDRNSYIRRRLGSAISSLKIFRWGRRRRGVTQANPASPATDVGIITQYLGLAISSLKNLECVVWRTSCYDPSWMQTIIMDALTGLPNFKDMQLTVSGDLLPPLQLDRLSGLKKISFSGYCNNFRSDIIDGIAEAIAKSPDLVYLEVKDHMYNPDPGATLHDLLRKVPQGSPLRLTHLVLAGMSARMDSFTLPHLRSLVYLNLGHLLEPSPVDGFGFIDPTRRCASKISDIFAALNREKIHIKHVVVDSVDDVILDYQSYSGLETLNVSSTTFSIAAQPDAMCYRLYNSVLPKHVDSIQALQPSYEGRWCYNLEDVPGVLAQCKKLRSLSVALTSGAVEAPKQLTIDPSQLCPHRYRDKFDDMISSLIKLSISLPYLAKISIYLADHKSHCSGRCGSSSMEHNDLVMEMIADSMTKFTLGDRKRSSKVLPVISVNRGWTWKHFQYQTLGEGLGCGYRMLNSRTASLYYLQADKEVGEYICTHKSRIAIR